MRRARGVRSIKNERKMRVWKSFIVMHDPIAASHVKVMPRTIWFMPATFLVKDQNQMNDRSLATR